MTGHKVLFLVLVLVALAGCASTPDEVPAPYLLAPLSGTGEMLPHETPVRVERPGILVELQSLSERERELWLRENTGLDQDPLQQLRRRRFLTLRARFEATGDKPLHVEIQSIRLWQVDSDASSPTLDYPRAYDLLRPDLESSPDAAEVERFMRGLLDGALDLPPGGSKEGLLVFPELPRSPGESVAFTLEMPFLQAGSTTHRVRIPFGSKEIEIAPPL